MFCGECQAAVAMGTAVNTRSECRAAHSSTCMPPIEPPMTQKSWSMPSLSISRTWASTMSPMVMTGKLRPYGFPVFGSMDAGPVDPMHPPMTLGQMTKNRLVSIGLPRPTIVSPPGRPSATYDDVGADDAEPARIDRLAATGHRLPPARLASYRMRVGGVLVARERMAHQDSIRLVRVKLAVRLVSLRKRRRCM